MVSTSGQSTTTSCYNVVTSSECRWNPVNGTNMLQNTMPLEWNVSPSHSVASVSVAYSECQVESSVRQSSSDRSALEIQISQSRGCNKIPSAVKKPKRVRTAFTTQQVLALDEEYVRNRYLERHRRIELSNFLELDERTVKIWFQNRRMKEKKDREESEANSTSESTEVHEHQYLPATSYLPVMPAPCPPFTMPSYVPPAMPDSYYPHSVPMPYQTTESDMAWHSGYQQTFQSSDTEYLELVPEVALGRHEPTPSGSSEDNDGDWSSLITSSLHFEN